MKFKTLFLLLFLGLSQFQSFSQSRENLENINKVWHKFYQAFETLDYSHMADIHSKELVRIAGGNRILDYQTYIDNYKSTFKNAKDQNITNHISLRFFERICNGVVASERGIYKLTRNQGKPNEHLFYGQFHVIFKKEQGDWKITMDYDSNENKTVGEKEFLAAYGIDELKYFEKKK